MVSHFYAYAYLFPFLGLDLLDKLRAQISFSPSGIILTTREVFPSAEADVLVVTFP